MKDIIIIDNKEIYEDNHKNEYVVLESCYTFGDWGTDILSFKSKQELLNYLNESITYFEKHNDQYSYEIIYYDDMSIPHNVEIVELEKTEKLNKEI